MTFYTLYRSVYFRKIYWVFNYGITCRKLVGPPNKFLIACGYLIENKYRLEHLKSASV